MFFLGSLVSSTNKTVLIICLVIVYLMDGKEHINLF